MFSKAIRTLIVVTALAVVVIAAALARPNVAAAQTKTNWDDPAQSVAAFVGSINGYWKWELSQHNLNYVAPQHIYWYGYTNTQGQQVVGYCHGGQIEYMNAEYCDEQNNIYLGYDFMTSQVQKNGAYAAVAILAHEWGHQISDQLGWLHWAQGRGFYQATELQADCFAGMYTRYAYDHTWLNAGNVSNAQMAFYGMGDAVSTSPYTAGSHGTAAQRLQWFNIGFNRESLNTCNSVYTALYGSAASN